MSAFIVTNRTISVIIAGLHTHQNEYMASKVYEAAGMNYRTTPEQEFGQALLSMNDAAVSQRYNEAEGGQEYRYTIEFPPSGPVLAKALNCLLYQCSEGDVPERPLFKALDDFRNYLCQQIVADLPTYKAAPWDFPESEAPALQRII